MVAVAVSGGAGYGMSGTITVSRSQEQKRNTRPIHSTHATSMPQHPNQQMLRAHLWLRERQVDGGEVLLSAAWNRLDAHDAGSHRGHLQGGPIGVRVLPRGDVGGGGGVGGGVHGGKDQQQHHGDGAAHVELRDDSCEASYA